MHLLHGKTPSEASGDASLRIPLLAAILNAQLRFEQHGWNFDFHAMRASYGLPVSESIDPGSTDLNVISLMRLARIDPAKCDTKRLLALFALAVRSHVPQAVRRIGCELVQRDDLSNVKMRGSIYGVLAGFANHADEAVGFLQHAEEAAVGAGESPAPWYLREIPVQVLRRDFDRFNWLVKTLSADHATEPGVAEAVYTLMVDIGVIDPARFAEAQRQEAFGFGPQPSRAAPPSGSIWTPGAAAPSKKKETPALRFESDEADARS
jgi:hypothetical protein